MKLTRIILTTFVLFYISNDVIWSQNTKDYTFPCKITLTSEGKFRESNDAISKIITEIPKGTVVTAKSKVNSYFEIYYQGITGYLNEMYFDNNNYATEGKSTQNQNSNFKAKKIKEFYKDGEVFQYYIHNGISITMQVSLDNNYGKYYTAYIAIENLSGEAFDFNPSSISAILNNNGDIVNCKVLSSNEYMKKVSNRQAWSAALVSIGQSFAANQAGYSTSKTTANINTYSTTSTNISAYYGNNYGSIYGNSNTYGNATVQSTTKSYDGAANYAAQQNAQRNINNYQNQQYQIKKELNAGYLKHNTIFNEQRIIGQISIKYEGKGALTIIVPVNGEDYKFGWSL